MKSFAPVFAIFVTLTAAQSGSVAVSDFYVDKHEDPLTLRIKVHYVSFTLDGYGADNLRCEYTNPPTFPSDILQCNDEKTNYRMSIATGAAGSGIQFSLDLYYNDLDQNINMYGETNVPTFCTLNEVDHDWREFRYNCDQLIPVSVDLACRLGCSGD